MNYHILEYPIMFRTFRGDYHQLRKLLLCCTLYICVINYGDKPCKALSALVLRRGWLKYKMDSRGTLGAKFSPCNHPRW